MKLYFSIDYLTHWGESVRVVLTLVNAKGRKQTQVHPLDTRDGRSWAGEVLVTEGNIRTFYYHYCIYKDDCVVRTEWRLVPRRFEADEGVPLPGRMEGHAGVFASLHFGLHAVCASPCAPCRGASLLQRHADVAGERPAA